MGQNKLITWGAVLVLALVLVFPLVPSVVWADDVTYYPTEDTWIREDHDDNYGTSSWLAICNDAENKGRALVRIDDQSGGGNVTSVLLKLYYGDEFGLDADGLAVRVYECTRDFVEVEADWYEYENGGDWTSEGGDWTVENYAEADMPTEGNWVTWNITDMAKHVWEDDGDDLYVLIRYKYETEGPDPDEMSWSFFRSAEGGANKCRVIVTYSEEIQTPEVDGDTNEVGSTTYKMNIYPTLYDWPTANVSAQVAPDGGAWTYASDNLTITDNSAVVRTVTGLSKSTDYVARARLTYASGTVYSGNVSFTTKDYDVPTWDIDVDSIELHNATVYASWTGNNDNKDVYAKIAYKLASEGSWTYTSSQNSALTTKEFDWDLTDLSSDREYDYKGMFTIEGYTYETDVEQFETGDVPHLYDYINDVDYNFVQFKIDYECRDADEIDLYVRIRQDGTSLWTNSDTREGLTGNGTEYFLFEGLATATLYEYQAIAEYDVYSATYNGEVWTVSIDEYPVLSNLNSIFVPGYTVRVSVDIVLNDVAYLEPDLYVQFRETGTTPWTRSDATTTVTDDGTWTVDITAGDEVGWQKTYDYYAVLDYTAGTNTTDADTFYVPSTPLYVETLPVEGVSGTSVTLRGYGSLSPVYEDGWLYFEYWVAGSPDDHVYVGGVEIDGPTTYEYTLEGLVYGETYRYRAVLLHDDFYGDTIEWRQGYWGADGPPSGEGAYAVYADMWDWLINSTAGHWTILLLGMVVAGAIFHRQRAVAVVVCLFILGIGIVIGWVDTWVIVLLALGAGLTVWRFVTARRGAL